MANPRIEPLKKVLAIDPNNEVAWFGLGKVYMEDSNYQEAVTVLEPLHQGQPFLFGHLPCSRPVTPEASIELSNADWCDQGIEASATNGDAMVTKNLSLLKQSLGQGDHNSPFNNAISRAFNGYPAEGLRMSSRTRG